MLEMSTGHGQDMAKEKKITSAFRTGKIEQMKVVQTRGYSTLMPTSKYTPSVIANRHLYIWQARSWHADDVVQTPHVASLLFFFFLTCPKLSVW